MAEEIKRGYIFLADLGEKIGSEQKGERPVVIIQNNVGNEFSPTVIIVPITSKVNEKARIPTHIVIKKKKYGLTYDSMILAEQTTTIDKKRLGNYIGTLTEEEILQLDFALTNAFGLDIDKMMNKKKNKNNENKVETLTRKQICSYAIVAKEYLKHTGNMEISNKIFGDYMLDLMDLIPINQIESKAEKYI